MLCGDFFYFGKGLLIPWIVGRTQPINGFIMSSHQITHIRFSTEQNQRITVVRSLLSNGEEVLEKLDEVIQRMEAGDTYFLIADNQRLEVFYEQAKNGEYDLKTSVGIRMPGSGKSGLQFLEAE